MRFKHFFLNEAQFQAQFPLDGIENLLLDGGLAGAITAIDHLSSVLATLKGDADKPTNKATKWDARVSIIFGKDPTTKAFFASINKGDGRPRVVYSSKDIAERFSGHEAEVLKYALRYLPELGVKKPVAADVLFIKPDVERTPDKMLKFKGKTKTYVVALGSDTGQEIYKKQMGIAIHTHFVGDDIKSMTRTEGLPHEVHSSRNVWVQSPQAHDLSGAISFTSSETREFTENLAKMVADYKGLDKYFVEQARAMSLFHAIKIYGSQQIGEGRHQGSVDTFINGFSEFVKHKYVLQIPNSSKDKVQKKAVEMINFLKRNIVNIRKTLEFYFLAAKTAELARVKLQNMKLVHGQTSASNVGMIITQGKNNTIQLVDRIGV